MIYDLKITTASGTRFNEMISQRFRWIREQDYSVTAQVLNYLPDDMEAYEIHLQGNRNDQVFRNEDIVYIFKHQLAEMIAEHILGEWEGRLINREIHRSCRGLAAEEKQIVYNKAAQFLRRCNDNESLNLLMNYGRKNRIAHRILDYIHSNPLIVVEGFINFCLQDYLTEIRFAVELAVEERKNEKEYNDFVTLLRYFVDTQVPKINEVNIMMDENGLFNMWMEADQDRGKLHELFSDDMLLNEINFDDVLISILITIAPRRIMLHNALNLAVSQWRLSKVFKKRSKYVQAVSAATSIQ